MDKHYDPELETPDSFIARSKFRGWAREVAYNRARENYRLWHEYVAELERRRMRE